MEHKWEDYFDTESEYWEKVQKIYKENDHFPKVVVKNRNLHHKFPRSFSKKDGTEIDNDKDNLVSLSLADHFLVHYYLWKCCNKKGYRRFMATAFQFMRKKAIKYATDDTIEMLAKDYADMMKDAAELFKTKEHRKKCSDAHKGKHHSEETKKKISEANKGKPSPFKGSHQPEEVKRKRSEALKGHIVSEETRKKLSEGRKGENNPNYGKPAWNKGITLSEETKRKISDELKGKHWKLVDGKRVYY